MSRRSALSALGASNGAFESVARMVARPAAMRRPFSTTQPRASITHFTPTSSAELDEVLNTIRYKIILPAYLPEDQRRRIYLARYQKQLQADPVVIEIDGEVIKFHFTDPLTQIPNTRRSVLQALQLCREPADFVNLRPLFEGLTYANRTFPPDFYCKVIRSVGRKGRIYDIIECARGAARTGFRLDSSEKVNEVLHFVQMRAADAAWDPRVLRQCLRWAEIVLDLTQHANHRRAEPLLPGELPLHQDPMVLLAPLHLAASLVEQYDIDAARAAAPDDSEAVTEAAPAPAPAEAEAEADGQAPGSNDAEETASRAANRAQAAAKAARYALYVARLWPEGRRLREVQPAAAYEDSTRLGYLRPGSKFVALATPLLHGLDVALRVLEPALADPLRPRRDLLAAEIDEARAALNLRASAVWEQFFGDGMLSSERDRLPDVAEASA
ncbi:hypothetical protein GGS23DRAFT_543404 [Durotheca rogersii]|uniref:uncharacterized protein n=1 Tax=Durotheca rogersii TaxID=419775 RepID=UPI00221EE090|nr:uncharacterized protein GGS23DRAFT_543404 [Durotheca rogersii]KAI5867969.1 hypothetical protein GGS23DRAFT_543404 [Durotheca rogersii]